MSKPAPEPETPAPKVTLAQLHGWTLATWTVFSSSGPRSYDAHRVLLAECGALTVMFENDVLAIFAPGSWDRVDRIPNE
jgi:hypothetical protein